MKISMNQETFWLGPWRSREGMVCSRLHKIRVHSTRFKVERTRWIHGGRKRIGPSHRVKIYFIETSDVALHEESKTDATSPSPSSTGWNRLIFIIQHLEISKPTLSRDNLLNSFSRSRSNRVNITEDISKTFLWNSVKYWKEREICCSRCFENVRKCINSRFEFDDWRETRR